MTYAIGLIDDKFDELLADYSWTLKGLRLTAEEVSEGCDFRDRWRPLSLNRLPDGDLVRVCRNGRRIAFVPVGARGRARLGPGVHVGSGRCAGVSSAGPTRLVLEVLLWLVGRYSEQGVMLHVCKMVLRHRLFRMTWLKVGARRALRAVGGAWRDSATMCYSGSGAGRSAGVLPGPVALRALEVASYRHSRRQGSGSTTHL